MKTDVVFWITDRLLAVCFFLEILQGLPKGEWDETRARLAFFPTRPYCHTALLSSR